MAKEIKQPKTVKLSTVIWVIAILVSLAIGIVIGLNYNSMFNNQVNAKAVELLKQRQ